MGKLHDQIIEDHIDRMLDWEIIHTLYGRGNTLSEGEIAERTGMDLADVERIMHDIKMKFKASKLAPRQL